MIDGLYEPFKRWSQFGSVWLFGDPHFGDEELSNAIPNRPTPEEQVKLINKTVGKNGTFVCLGDVGEIEWVRQIKGYKVLICGNHDVGASNYKRRLISRWEPKKDNSLEEIKKELERKHPGYVVELNKHYENNSYFTLNLDNRLFDEVYTGPLVIGEKIILSHEPLPNIDWALNLHGHNHNGGKTDIYHYNCCADVINYMPINLGQLIKDGALSKIDSIHRLTIDEATERKKKRGS